MTTHPTPAPNRRSHAGRKTFLVWILCLAEIILYSYGQPITDRLGLTPFLTFLTFLCSLVFIALTLYLITVSIRWLLRKLFWRVGRRLFLSYVLIGMLPFFLMTILLLAIGYMIAGVMSHAALRGERQATLGQMESQALEYGLTGKKPADRLRTLEIYDTAAGDTDKLPAWLRKTSFSGIVSRDDKPLLVASRQFAGSEGEMRSVVFVQPIDEEWARQLEEKGGMIIAHDDGSKKEKANVGTITVNGRKKRVILSGDSAFDEIMRRGFGFGRVLWADPVAPTSWETGETDRDKQFLTLLSNPISNLFQFYFGASSGSYMRILANVILALVVMLCIIYMFAAAFAAVLIFSISRAVNRIEKGTKADRKSVV